MVAVWSKPRICVSVVIREESQLKYPYSSLLDLAMEILSFVDLPTFRVTRKVFCGFPLPS